MMGKIVNRILYLDTVPSFNRCLTMTVELCQSCLLEVAFRGFYYQYWGVKNSWIYSENGGAAVFFSFGFLWFSYSFLIVFLKFSLVSSFLIHGSNN